MINFMTGDSYCYEPDGGSDTITGPPLEVSALDTSQSDQGQYSLHSFKMSCLINRPYMI